MKRVLLALGGWLVGGCEGWYEFEYYTVNCGGELGLVNIATDPLYCGGCPPLGEACPEGVVCREGMCDYTSTMHCGARGRVCLGFEGVSGVECVGIREGEGGEWASHGPVVHRRTHAEDGKGELVGYACAAVDGLGGGGGLPVERPGVEPGPVGVVPPGVVGIEEPSWVFMPGQTPGCRGEGEDARCHTGMVEVVDSCGARCSVSFDEDIEVMTTELSRAQYRAAMCDCGAATTDLCADLCSDRSREALPMAGLHWCNAYEVCAAFGGRLPTALDRARIEQLASVPAHLMTGAPSCSDWREAVGSAPWVAECIDDRADIVIDRIDSPSGALPIGADVLPTPRLLHHYFGNSREWQADALGGLTCAAIQAGRSSDGDKYAPRVARSRSVLGAVGEALESPVALSPRTRAEDLGVRCVRPRRLDTSGRPPVRADLLAECDPSSPIGVRPVRQAERVPVYRAAQACVDLRSPSAAAFEVTVTFDQLARSLLDDTTPLTVYDDRGLVEVGRAWLAGDEQWWIAEPAAGPDDPLDPVTPIVAHFDEQTSVPLSLLGERLLAEVGPGCVDGMAMSLESRADGHRLRAFDFSIPRERLSAIFAWMTPAEVHRIACQQLGCVDAGVDDARCEVDCPAWSLTVVFDLQQLEPNRHAALICQPEQAR